MTQKGSADESSVQLNDPFIDIFENDDALSLPAPMSYKMVKDWQYHMHSRDREKREPFSWWAADVSFMPVFPT